MPPPARADDLPTVEIDAQENLNSRLNRDLAARANEEKEESSDDFLEESDEEGAAGNRGQTQTQRMRKAASGGGGNKRSSDNTYDAQAVPGGNELPPARKSGKKLKSVKSKELGNVDGDGASASSMSKASTAGKFKKVGNAVRMANASGKKSGKKRASAGDGASRSSTGKRGSKKVRSRVASEKGVYWDPSAYSDDDGDLQEF